MPLYGSSSHLSSAQHSINRYRKAKAGLRQVADSAAESEEHRTKAKDQLKEMEAAELLQEVALEETSKRCATTATSRASAPTAARSSSATCTSASRC